MGKLTVKEAEDLVEQGILSKKALEEMQSSGLVSSRRHSTRRYMKTSDGKWVTPQLYFQGLGKDGNYSKKMAKENNQKKLDWSDPGGHHHESIFTKFDLEICISWTLYLDYKWFS